MKFKELFFILLFFVSETCGESSLVVVLMVKDEAPVLVQTLQPLVDGGIKNFVIFDTGSTDGTQAVARGLFQKHAVNAHIVEEPFIDFSTSRNRALTVAQSLFPRATFMLMPDAEWYLHNVEGLLQFCAEHKDDNHASYFIHIKNSAIDFCVSRLIRCHTNIHFVGAVHEALNQLTTITLPDTIYFEWRPSQIGKDKSIKRWQRDRDLLVKSYEHNPTDARTLFYLAQTYDCLGDWENAYIYYKKRAAVHGWDEENFVTLLRLGKVAEQLGLETSIGYYLKAFSLRPQRAEPLIQLAQYYVDRDEMHLAFLFASRAVHIPYPTEDILFIEKYLYDFVRYDLLGRCAWYVGQYELGEWAVRQALAIEPEAQYLNRNLKFYTDRFLVNSSGS